MGPGAPPGVGAGTGEGEGEGEGLAGAAPIDPRSGMSTFCTSLQEGRQAGSHAFQFILAEHLLAADPRYWQGVLVSLQEGKGRGRGRHGATKQVRACGAEQTGGGCVYGGTGAVCVGGGRGRRSGLGVSVRLATPCRSPQQGEATRFFFFFDGRTVESATLQGPSPSPICLPHLRSYPGLSTLSMTYTQLLQTCTGGRPGAGWGGVVRPHQGVNGCEWV